MGNVNNKSWILLDTETTGLSAPIFVVELAAQRMRGWSAEGEPFRKLLNQNQEIPAEASRVHGYTREILERDGEPAQQVYREFAAYAGNLPLVSYNLEYDLDEVLQPEWRRLRIAPVGQRGFCALRLAQRLLDPVPAGNCKLQTLRQYYRLPERGAHTALGDVQTVADLFANVLRPIAGHRGLDSWEKLAAFAAEEWYPSRIAFGKHKGRLIQEARKDAELRRWLDWLAGSANSRNAKMGRWYLRQLEKDLPADATVFATAGIDGKRAQSFFQSGTGGAGHLRQPGIGGIAAACVGRAGAAGGIGSGLCQGEIARGRDAGGVVPAVARALPETRPAATDFGLPEEISGFAGARRRGGGETGRGELREGQGADGQGLRGNGGGGGGKEGIDGGRGGGIESACGASW